jgi:carotenoid cleavage dioxygenase-like enzyme
MNDMKTVASSAAAPSRLDGILGYEFTEAAHPLYSLTSDDTYNVAVCLTLEGPALVLLKESPLGSRRVVGKRIITGDDEQTGIPYIHSFGLTSRYAVVVMQPLRITLDVGRLLEVGMLQSFLPVDHTRVIVFDIESGRRRLAFG